MLVNLALKFFFLVNKFKNAIIVNNPIISENFYIRIFPLNSSIIYD